MTDETKTEEKAEKPTRVKRTNARPVRSPESASLTNEALTATEENPTPAGEKVITKGQDIEVNTDDDGIALETVWEERDLPGTDKKTRVLVAAAGTTVPAHLRANK